MSDYIRLKKITTYAQDIKEYMMKNSQLWTPVHCQIEPATSVDAPKIKEMADASEIESTRTISERSMKLV